MNKRSKFTDRAPVGNSLIMGEAQSRVSLRTISAVPSLSLDPDSVASLNELKRSSTTLFKRAMSYEKVIPKGFGTLPVQILVLIFKYIDIGELLRSVSLVCRQWKHGVMQPEIITSFTASSSIPLYYIFDHLRKFTSIRSLHLENIASPMCILIQAAKFLTNLENLSLKECHCLEPNVLRYIILTFPKLKGLNLENTTFADPTPRYSTIAALNNLTRLIISRMPDITIKDILETVLNSRKLEYLDVGFLPPEVDLNDEYACLIINNLSENLKSISMDARALTNKTFEKLFKCPKLERLFINHSVNLTAEFLLEYSKNLQNIKGLGFSHNCNIKGTDFCTLFQISKHNFNKITCLDLTHCALLNNESIKAIAACCRNLEIFHIKSCRKITNIDYLCLNCRELQFLNIAFCDNLKLTFVIPSKLNKLIIHNGKEFLILLRKLDLKNIKVFVSLSEYTEDMKRLS